MSVTKKNLTRSWFVWGIASVFYLYEMMLRVSPTVMTDNIMSSFNITSTMFGVMISFYYYAYTLFQLPCGFILDKLGPRNLLGISTILCIIGTVIFASTQYIYAAQIGRFLIGSGSACAFISCLHVSSEMFPKKYFSTLAGATNMMGTVGGMFGGMPVAKLVNAVGWRNSLYWLAAVGIVIFILVFIFVPKMKTEPREKKPLNISKIFANKQVILAAVVAGLMYLPISAFAELWATPFFRSAYKISNELASYASSFLYIGVAIGSVLLAVFARKINSYMKTIKMSAIMVAVLFVVLISCNLSLYIAYAIVFAIGVFTGAQVINFTCVKDNVSQEIVGTTLALANAIIMLIGSVAQPALGFFLDYFWNGKFGLSGIRDYDITCYRKAIIILPISLLLAYFVSLFIKETINNDVDEKA